MGHFIKKGAVCCAVLVGALTGLPQAQAQVFSDEVKDLIEQKLAMIREMAKNPLVIQAAEESNQKNFGLTLPDILALNAQWVASEESSPFIKPYLLNPCAQFLVDFQEKHEEFPEIFITDNRGLNVAQTNRTSDFYQADEKWWVDAYNGGQGRSFYGPIEYDESAFSEVIPLYAPIIQPESGKAIGVIKALCDITAIKMGVIGDASKYSD
ncbi:MAG: hypothetical protein NC819_00990 [Candidatus Omnitrophica bacterium]|nr:hypothetical protein [Candidatus Omnitrophota bacterium]